MGRHSSADVLVEREKYILQPSLIGTSLVSRKNKAEKMKLEGLIANLSG